MSMKKYNAKPWVVIIIASVLLYSIFIDQILVNICYICSSIQKHSCSKLIHHRQNEWYSIGIDVRKLIYTVNVIVYNCNGSINYWNIGFRKVIFDRITPVIGENLRFRIIKKEWDTANMLTYITMTFSEFKVIYFFIECFCCNWQSLN